MMGASEGHPGSCAADAQHRAVAHPRARHDVLNGKMEFVEGAGFRADARNRASQFAVLRIVRIRDDLNGFDYIDGEIESRAAGRRIGDIGAVDECATLGIARTFHVDAAVRSANHARNQRKHILHPIILVGRVSNRLLRDGLVGGRCLNFRLQ